jgi:pSer/pThr/pTyr-binding forkhead associated (FHA) protein
MTNRNELAAYASSLVNMSEHTELQERLKLYQVFLKLYNRHRSLLHEILDAENLTDSALAGITMPYVQGFVSESQSYLVTNLIGGETQALVQPQQVWVIGRDNRQSLISVQDIRLSRRHAAIQYVADPNLLVQGFYLIDLDSRNQSLVNGEPVRRVRLKDGDQIRLGGLSFTFFLCHSAQTLAPLPPDLLARLQSSLIDQPDSFSLVDLDFDLNLEEVEDDTSPTLDL